MTTHSKITLWDDSTRLSPHGTHSGVDITIQNLDASHNVFIGGANVNSNNFGYRLSPGAAISLELSGQDALYGYSDYQVSVAILITSLEAGS